MIYTVTTNPSLDYYMSFNGEIKHGYNRSEKEYFVAGGKGLNVSIFLDKLNIPSTTIGFLGGFTKECYLEQLKQYRCIRPLFTNIKEAIRINVKVVNGTETSLNAKGPHISDEEFKKFEYSLKQLYDDDIVVISGNIQEDLKDKMVELINSLLTEGIKVILDTDADVMKRCLNNKPFLIKLNEGDVENNEEKVKEELQYYADNGAKNVLYSSNELDKHFFANKYKHYYYQKNDGLLPSIGTSDSLIAGFVYSKLRGASDDEALKYGIAVSETFTINTTNKTNADVEEMYEHIEIGTY